MEALVGALVMLVGVIGVLALLALFIAFSAMFNGWALTKLWGWFIVPVFHLPMLTLPMAMGLSLVVSFLTYQHQSTTTAKDDKEKKERSINFFVLIFLRPLIVVGIGYVIHSFM